MPTKADPKSVKRFIVRSHDPNTICEETGRIDPFNHFFKHGFSECPPWAAVAPGFHFKTKLAALSKAEELRDALINDLSARIEELAKITYIQKAG